MVLKTNVNGSIMYLEVCMFNFLVLIVNSAVAQVLMFGKCDEVETVEYFDLEKFLGVWYEIQRYPTWYEQYGHCAYKKINYCDCNIGIEHGFVKDHIEYVLHVNTTHKPGDDAIFKIEVNNVDPIGTPLSVVATNYEDYAVIYGCKYDGSMDVKYVWILSRLKTLSAEYLSTSYEIMTRIPQTSTAYLQKVNHNEEMCKHYWTAHVQAENSTAGVDDIRQHLFKNNKYLEL